MSAEEVDALSTALTGILTAISPLPKHDQRRVLISALIFVGIYNETAEQLQLELRRPR